MTEKEKIVGQEKAAQKADALMNEVLKPKEDGKREFDIDGAVILMGEKIIEHLAGEIPKAPWWCLRPVTNDKDFVRIAETAAKLVHLLRCANMTIVASGIVNAGGKAPKLPFSCGDLAMQIMQMLNDVKRD